VWFEFKGARASTCVDKAVSAHMEAVRVIVELIGGVKTLRSDWPIAAECEWQVY
jgi:hypothetical protein